MRKFTALSMAFMLGAGFVAGAQEAYVVGPFNNYGEDLSEEWQLTKEEGADDYISFRGYVEIPAGDFEINFLVDDTYYVPATLSNEEFEFDPEWGDYFGGVVAGQANNGYFINEDWEGGEISILLDLTEGMVVFETAVSGDNQPAGELWYVRGEFNDYNPDGSALYALAPVEGENGLYTGTVEIPAGQFSFNLLSPYMGLVFIPVSLETMEIEFTDNVFEGKMDYAFEDYEYFAYWTYPDWEGGAVTITVNGNTGDITIEAVNDVETSIYINHADGEKIIYNLQGVRMSENNLSNGIYIINGKKVLVRSK